MVGGYIYIIFSGEGQGGEAGEAGESSEKYLRHLGDWGLGQFATGPRGICVGHPTPLLTSPVCGRGKAASENGGGTPAGAPCGRDSQRRDNPPSPKIQCGEAGTASP